MVGWIGTRQNLGYEVQENLEVIWVSFDLFKGTQNYVLLILIMDFFFLVRESDRKPGSYVLSYLGRTGINHFR